MSDAEYTQEINAWREKLDQSLRAENGWLALAGLFWLEPGTNGFGAAPENAIQLPGDDLPGHIGDFILKDGSVRLELHQPGELILNDLPPVNQTLQPDVSGEPDVLTLGPLTMMVIERGDLIGIRLWDNQRPERTEFTGRSWFPIQAEFCVEARLERHDPPLELQIVSTAGVTQPAKGVGRLSFQVAGKTCSLEALDGGEDALSLIFKDASADTQTYPSGRFLVAPLEEDDRVMLDFNRAYNPPCAFSVYTTCPLPPPENILSVRIEAGERYLGHPNLGLD